MSSNALCQSVWIFHGNGFSSLRRSAKCRVRSRTPWMCSSSIWLTIRSRTGSSSLSRSVRSASRRGFKEARKTPDGPPSMTARRSTPQCRSRASPCFACSASRRNVIGRFLYGLQGAQDIHEPGSLKVAFASEVRRGRAEDMLDAGGLSAELPVARDQERGCAADVWSCHARSIHAFEILFAAYRRLDLFSRRDEIGLG